jgi:hypothetical protein
MRNESNDVRRVNVSLAICTWFDPTLRDHDDEAAAADEFEDQSEQLYWGIIPVCGTHTGNFTDSSTPGHYWPARTLNPG